MDKPLSVPRILQWRGFTWCVTGPGIWGMEVRQCSPGAMPAVEGLGDEVIQKLKQSVK